MLWTISIFNRWKRHQRLDIKDNDQKYQLVCCYDVSKTSVSFRYQLKRLCDVVSCSVSLRYQLVHRYDISNWSGFFTYLRDVAKTSQIGPSYWRTSWVVMRIVVPVWSRTFRLVSKMDQFILGTKQYVFRHLQWFSLIKEPASTSLQCLKEVGLI